MALYKRGSIWWVRLTSPSGQHIRRSSGTTIKVEAREFHDRLRAELWRVHKLHVKPVKRWEDAAKQWLIESPHKADHRKDAAKLEWLKKHLDGTRLDQVDRSLIGTIGDIKAREASPATANRYLALIRAILRKAKNEWEWLETTPKVRMFQEPSRRIRWLNQLEAERLLRELPSHQAELARFALATGLRKSNVLGLEWSQVDLIRRVAWIHADQAKSRKAIAVPLNDDAVDVVRRQHGRHRRFVFTYKMKPIRQVNTASWKKALKRAGIENFRWHDLRHTWASWHVQAGTPLHALQELGGWESVEMVRRYAHLAPEHLAVHASGITQGTILAQSKKREARSTG